MKGLFFSPKRCLLRLIRPFKLYFVHLSCFYFVLSHVLWFAFVFSTLCCISCMNCRIEIIIIISDLIINDIIIYISSISVFSAVKSQVNVCWNRVKQIKWRICCDERSQCANDWRAAAALWLERFEGERSVSLRPAEAVTAAHSVASSLGRLPDYGPLDTDARLAPHCVKSSIRGV